MARVGLPELASEPSLPARIPRAGLVALAVGYLLLATAYNVATPVFEAADEHTHYFVAQQLARGGGLPVQSRGPSEAPAGPWEQEGSQPPLYYWLAAPLVRLARAKLAPEELRYNHQNTMGQPALVGNENRFIHSPQAEGRPWHGYVLAVHLIRGLSTLFGLVAVLSATWLGWQAFPGRGWLAIAVGAVVAFNPQFLHVTASVSNDAAITALATVGLAVLLRWWRQPSVGWALALGLSLALAALTKLSGLVLLAFVLSCLCLRAAQRRDARCALQTAAIVVLAVASLAGWWYGRNQRLYGSWTGLEAMLGDQLRRDMRLGRWLRGLPAELWGVWLSYWGVFGWFTLMLPTWLYASYSALTVGGLIGVLGAWRRRVDWASWPTVWTLVAWWGVMAASLLRWLAMTKGGTGRLLFPGVGALAVIVVLGWRHLGRRPTDRTLAGGLASSLFVLAALSLWGVLRPAYAWPAVIDPAHVPPTAKAASVVFGEGLRLLAVDSPERVREGRRFAITLYWQVVAPTERDGYVAIRLDQAVAGEQNLGQGFVRAAGRPWLSYLGQGNAPPDLLPSGSEVYVDRRLLTAPELATQFQLPPGEGAMARAYRLPIVAELSVHVYELAARASWPMRDLSGEAATADFSVPIVLEPRQSNDRQRLCSRRPVARFGNGMSLHLLDAAGSGGAPLRLEKQPGQEAVLYVAWETERPPAEELSAFIHLATTAPQPITQADGPPATHGRYPTQYWPARECLPARLTVGMPRDLAGGKDYRLLAGLYRTGRPDARIEAAQADGTPWPNAAVHLADVRLVP